MTSFLKKPGPNLPKKSKMNDLFEPRATEYLNPAVMKIPDDELHRKLIEAETTVKTADETHKKYNTPETKNILDKAQKLFSDLMNIYEQKKKIKDIRATLKDEREWNEWLKQHEKRTNDVIDPLKASMDEMKRLDDEFHILLNKINTERQEHENKTMKQLEEHQNKLTEIYSRGGKTRKHRKGSKKTMKKKTRKHRK